MGNKSGALRCCGALEGRGLNRDDFIEAFESHTARETALTVFVSVAQRVYFESVRARAHAASQGPNFLRSDAKGVRTTAGGVRYAVAHGDATPAVDEVVAAIRGNEVGMVIVLTPCDQLWGEQPKDRGSTVSKKGEELKRDLAVRGFDSEIHTTPSGGGAAAVVFRTTGTPVPTVSGEVVWAKPVGHFKHNVSGGEVAVYRFRVGGNEVIEMMLTDYHFVTMAKVLRVDLAKPPDLEMLEEGPEMLEEAPEEQTRFDIEQVAVSDTVPKDVCKMFGRAPGEHGLTKTVHPLVEARDPVSLRKLIDRPYNLLTGVILLPDERTPVPVSCAAALVSPGLLTRPYAESVAKLCERAQSFQ